MIIGLFRKKSKQGGLRTYFFEIKKLKFLGLLLYPWKFSTKQSFTLANFVKLCYTPWKYKDQKRKIMEIQHDVSFIDP